MAPGFMQLREFLFFMQFQNIKYECCALFDCPDAFREYKGVRKVLSSASQKKHLTK